MAERCQLSHSTLAGRVLAVWHTLNVLKSVLLLWRQFNPKFFNDVRPELAADFLQVWTARSYSTFSEGFVAVLLERDAQRCYSLRFFLERLLDIVQEHDRQCITEAER